MKKTFGTIFFAVAVVLCTATFSLAEYAAGGPENFPYFQFGLLIIGALLIFSLKQKYAQMYMGEAVGAMALYTMLIALFTTPVIDAVRTLVS